MTQPARHAQLESEDPALRPIGDLLGDVTEDLTLLLRQEVELAKAELTQSLSHARAGATMLGAGAVAGHLALIFLSIAAWWALGQEIGLGWSALAVGVVWALLAAVLATAGKSRMRHVTPIAPRTVSTTQEIPDALKGQDTP